MPVFELQTQDGRRFEVEAPTMEEAAKALDGMESAAPEKAVEPKQPEISGPPEQARTPLAARGPVGEALAGIRGDVRSNIAERPFLDQLLIEMSPSLVGTAVGGALGAPLGPIGVLLGATGGGLAGEFLGQASGIAPESDVMLGVSGAAPVAARGVAGAARIAGRGVGGFLKKVPAVRAARAINTEREIVSEALESSTKELAKQRGLLARDADDLYKALRGTNAVFESSKFSRTTTAISELSDELGPLAAFPEVNGALKVAQQLGDTLARNEPVPLETLIRAKQQIGALVGRFTKREGVKLAVPKKLYAAISNDLDDLAQAAGTGTGEERALRLAKAASTRFKMQQSAEEFREAVSRNLYDLPGGTERALNVKNLRKWLGDISDPQNAKYDKNFVDGMGNTLKEIKTRLAEVSKITDVSRSAAGSGSIVVRGITAGGGALIGGALLGPAGAAGGALFGATAPDDLLRILTNPRGAQMLARALKRGRGQVDVETLSRIGQAIAQLGTRPGQIEAPSPRKARGIPFSQTPSMLNLSIPNGGIGLAEGQ